ncbi:MAG: tetratricopeptide repeat protein [archaeon]
MEIVSDEVKGKLETAREYCCKQAELSLGFREMADAVQSLSRCTQYTYFLNALNNPLKSSCALVKMTVSDVLEESKFWRKNLGKAIVHSSSPQEAENNIQGMLSGNNQLFWQAYFYAEHWQNAQALNLFANLVEKDPSVKNIHWYGNLLSKQGRFSEARQPLEIAARLEPTRYNHHSHLGNVYRGLGMKEDAKKAYKKALGLIFDRKEIGRVEYLHLVRCFQGLTQLGERDYQELESETTKLALGSGSVSSGELERIKF